MPTRVLLTNDDGISALGLTALERAFSALPDVDLWVVAPDRGRSTCSHGMTISRPIFTEDLGPKRVAVDGLPADCVYFALFGLMPERPDVVVSGINQGANLGRDVIYSGTVAGAREAAILGVNGISVSLVEGTDFDRVAKNAADLALALAKLRMSPALLLNVNYPAGDFKGPRLAPLGERYYPMVVRKRISELTGRPYYWLGGPAVKDKLVPGTDGWLISKGQASATWLALDQTDFKMNAPKAQAIIPLIEPPEEPL
jgi:5'-nucleotidase